jgi:hypothetical protein
VKRESGLFPTVLWFVLAGLVSAAAYAAWRAAVTEGGWPGVFFSQLLWPGAAIFAVVFIVAFAGWKLDID